MNYWLGRFKKYVDVTRAYDTVYDYSPKTLTGTLTDSNKAEYGVYAINSDNSYLLELYLLVY